MTNRRSASKRRRELTPDPPDLDNDRLGCLPPGTLALCLYPLYPYWPSVILSKSEAQRQSALQENLTDIISGKVAGCAVRFFGVDTCAVLEATAVEPLLVNEYVD